MTLVRCNTGNYPYRYGVSRFGRSYIPTDEFSNYFNFNQRRNGNIPATNISESDTAYKIELAIPGLNKSDLRLNVEKDILTISREVKNGHEVDNERFNRREFHYGPFERTFWIPDSVDSEKIKAKYEKGILMITLPRKEEVKKESRQISIS